MIYTVTLNPALDKTVVIPHFRADTVNRVTNVRMDPGGKGINVSKVLAELGEASVAFGFAGGAAGQALRRMLAERGLESELYEADGETRTNLKIIDPASHTNTDINEPGPQVSATALEELLRRLLARIAPGDLVVLSGSLPAGAPADLRLDGRGHGLLPAGGRARFPGCGRGGARARAAGRAVSDQAQPG